ncbi:MAG: radical SAM family heme chaperone HemW [Chloroflexota bacterium]
MVTRTIALYIHVPFCRRKCPYCAFVSYEHREADIPRYLSALKKELEQRAGGERVSSVYFGGGTPSLLPAEYLGDIISTIRSLFVVDEAAEITIEANPGTINQAYLASIRPVGVNRLSLGVQSLNDRELGLLGRVHAAAEAIDAVKLARGSGFDNLNIDLIYGLPGQSLPDWQMTLSQALAMTPEHLSLYALSLEPGTPLRQAIENKSLPAIETDMSADQYELAEDLLAEHGYRHYEISNWARPGRECRHNLAYWLNQPYLGAGVAAHSYLDGHRLANTRSLDKYLTDFSGKSPPLPEMDEAISPELELAETIILGLRRCEGIDINTMTQQFDIDIRTRYQKPFEEMTGAGLLEQTGERIRLTRRGRLLGNEVFWRFLPG